jgi:hypothetical protein
MFDDENVAQMGFEVDRIYISAKRHIAGTALAGPIIGEITKDVAARKVRTTLHNQRFRANAL